MSRLVAVVICAALVVPVAAASTPSPLLRRAAALTGLKVQRPVRVVLESSTRFDDDAKRALDLYYPPSLQRVDDALYTGLGLLPAQASIRSPLVASAQMTRAQYDPSARVVRARKQPTARPSELLRELARALVDQNYGLRRLNGLRARDRDAALAAQAVVDGTAALASGMRAPAPSGTPLQRFLALEQNVGLDFGRNLLEQLRYVGGRFALQAALRSFPRTTEQLLHVDKFLQREPAQNVSLATTIYDLDLSASQTFGELDVLALLRAYDLTDADSVAAGWGGGRVALYSAANGTSVVALVLRWDSEEDSAEWRATVSRYVAVAFPDATARECPAVDACWLDGTRELATASAGNSTVFASGTNGELVAATIAASAGVTRPPSR